ncbi:MAG: glycosyltransferase family 2 protein [Polyangiales bacterium]
MSDNQDPVTGAFQSIRESELGERATVPGLPRTQDQLRVMIVIAAYNEASSIGDVVRELRSHYTHVVVVDDGSADETATYALEAGASVLTHLINRGQGAALQTGITYALDQGADLIVTFDADGQHDVNDIPQLLAPIAQGQAHIALGSRFLAPGGKIPRSRKLLLWAAVLFTRMTARVRLTDAHNGLRAFSRHAAEQIDLQLDRMAHASEIVDQVVSTRLPFVEVPVKVRYTEYSLRKGQRNSAALRVAFDYLMARLIR